MRGCQSGCPKPEARVPSAYLHLRTRTACGLHGHPRRKSPALFLPRRRWGWGGRGEARWPARAQRPGLVSRRACAHTAPVLLTSDYSLLPARPRQRGACSFGRGWGRVLWDGGWEPCRVVRVGRRAVQIWTRARGVVRDYVAPGRPGARSGSRACCRRCGPSMMTSAPGATRLNWIGWGGSGLLRPGVRSCLAAAPTRVLALLLLRSRVFYYRASVRWSCLVLPFSPRAVWTLAR